MSSSLPPLSPSVLSLSFKLVRVHSPRTSATLVELFLVLHKLLVIGHPPAHFIVHSRVGRSPVVVSSDRCVGSRARAAGQSITLVGIGGFQGWSEVLLSVPLHPLNLLLILSDLFLVLMHLRIKFFHMNFLSTSVTSVVPRVVS